MRLAAILFVTLLALLPATNAFAHAELIGSNPADGDTIPRDPGRLVLTFNEPVSPLVLRLVDPQAHVSTLETITQLSNRLLIELPEPLGQGTHVVSWRVVSADGHPVGGTIMFSVGRPSAAPSAKLLIASDPPVRLALWLVRLTLLVSLIGGIGGAVFATWVAGARPLPRSAELSIRVLSLIGLLILPLSVGVQGIDALAQPLSALAETQVWNTGFGTAYGTTAVIAAGALVCGLLAMSVPRLAAARGLAAIALAGLGLALSSSGHAATAAPRWLMQPVVFAHAVALTFWVGSLFPLAACLRTGEVSRRPALGRFSRAITFVVVLLVASGAVLTVVQLDRINALWTTAYGAVLAGKLATLVLLFVIAAVNRFRLTPQVMAGDAAAARRLANAISLELVLVLIVLGLVATWRLTAPPRALAPPAPVSTHVHTLQGMVDVSLDPGNVGRSRAVILVRDAKLDVIPAKEVTLLLSRPEAGIETITRPAAKAGDGTWRIDDLMVPLAGRWNLRVDVLVGDFEKMILEGTIDIPP